MNFKEGLDNNTLLYVYKIATILDVKKYYTEPSKIYYDQNDKELFLFTANLIFERLFEFMSTVYELKKVFIENHQLHKEEFFRQQQELYTRNYYEEQ